MRLPAPRLPFTSNPDPRLAGFRDPQGREWCPECAGVSLYFFDAEVRLPRGWKKLLGVRRRVACERCEERPNP